MSRKFEVVKAYQEQQINLPRRKTKFSAGYDLEAAVELTIPPNGMVVVPTGLKAYMASDEVLQLYIRSSLAVKHLLSLVNGTGIIDADYADNPSNEGHLQIAILNHSSEEINIKKGQAIAQGIFMKYLLIDNDEPGGCRSGGFGSTDINKKTLE